jgi:hypothetical protein
MEGHSSRLKQVGDRISELENKKENRRSLSQTIQQL